MTLEDVIATIDSLFADTSCSKKKTKQRLEEIAEHVDSCLSLLE